MNHGSFNQGLLCGVLLMLGASALYWFIATWQPDVSPVRTALVAAQLVVGLGGGIWTWAHARRARPA